MLLTKMDEQKIRGTMRMDEVDGTVLRSPHGHVVVVGGGITGLATAYALQRTAPRLDVTLVEATTGLGGKIVTERTNGFIIEGGPDSFLSSKVPGLRLCTDLGLRDSLQGPDLSTRRTYVLLHGRLHRLPEGLSGLVPARLGPMFRSDLLSWRGKARFALDFLLPARRSTGDESLAAFVQRRFGYEVYDHVIEPLMAGIYAGNGAELSLNATFPQLRQMERDHGSILRGIRQRQPSRTAPVDADPLPTFLTPINGMMEIVETLARALNRVLIVTGTRVRRVSHADEGFRVELEGSAPLRADSVILATPAFISADLLAGLDARIATILHSIPYVASATISVAFRREDVPGTVDGHGLIVPRAEESSLLACTLTSNKFPSRAPHGFSLMRAFLGRAGRDDITSQGDSALLALVRTELRQTLRITAEPVMHRIFRWPHAMPQYTFGHLDRIRSVEEHLMEHPGIFVAGSAYRGVGIPDCIASGELAASRAVAHLRNGATTTELEKMKARIT